jgi:ArsR family transcriptional regulator
MSEMVNQCNEQAKLFKALSHPARLAILELLRFDEHCVCHLEAALGLRQAYISQQLIILREAGLIQDRRDGWNIFYRVVRPEIYSVIDAAQHMTKRNLAGQMLTRFENAICECPKCKQKVELAAAPILERME